MLTSDKDMFALKKYRLIFGYNFYDVEKMIRDARISSPDSWIISSAAQLQSFLCTVIGESLTEEVVAGTSTSYFQEVECSHHPNGRVVEESSYFVFVAQNGDSPNSLLAVPPSPRYL